MVDRAKKTFHDSKSNFEEFTTQNRISKSFSPFRKKIFILQSKSSEFGRKINMFWGCLTNIWNQGGGQQDDDHDLYVT